MTTILVILGKVERILGTDRGPRAGTEGGDEAPPRRPRPLPQTGG
jgi:hypothetical protein